MRRRLDDELVRRGLAPTRDRARVEIAAGRVRVGGSPTPNAGRLVAAAEPILVAGEPARFVGRGGEKLEAALSHFGIDVTGALCLDAGASTGGFTDCLLQRGASKVVAVDVGHGHLHERLRRDSRVVVRERTNVRDLDGITAGGPFGVVTVDLSFISLRTVMSVLVGMLEPGGHMVALVKPQFEAERAEASRGKGVIKDDAIWRRTVNRVVESVHAEGGRVKGIMESPLTGARGNVEFFLHATVAAQTR